jgi:hypothetical protein
VVHHCSESAVPGCQSAPKEGPMARPDRGSINDLCYSPLMLTAHITARLLCDELAIHGDGVTVSFADVPHAFKTNPSNPDLLWLHVTQLAGPEDKVEYFVERCNTFGWTPSEWGWQAELAIIKWCLEGRGVDHVHAYVDNFFRINPPASSAMTRDAEFRHHMAQLSIKLHEDGCGTQLKALGWQLDLARSDHPRGWRMTMTCPEDKRAFYKARFAEWAAATEISLRDIASAAGIAQYLAGGFPAGAAYVAPLLALNRYAGVSTEKRRTLNKPPLRTIKVWPAAHEAFAFYHSMLEAWDGTCPITSGFSPAAPAERHGWVDAATTKGHGVGGVYWNAATRTLYGFMRPWSDDERERAMCIQRESTGVLEALAILAWIEVFGHLCELRRTLLRTDNEAAMLAYWKAFSTSAPMMNALRAARLAVGHLHMRLRVVQVTGKAFNLISDLLSHQRWSDAAEMALKLFGVDMQRVDAPAAFLLPCTPQRQ